MRRRLIIIGTGGLAREMAMLAEHVNAREHRWELMGFIGNSTALVGKDLGLGTIIGDDEWLLSESIDADLLIAIGRPAIRASVLARYLAQGERFAYPNLIHPSATLDYRGVQLGRGNVITAGCRFTCDIEVQDFNLFDLNATVGYDAHIGSYNVVHAGVNIANGVQIGDRNLLGSGCQVLEYLSIGDGLALEPGAIVRHDVLDAW